MAYTGKWYEVYRDKWNPHTMMADCVTKEYSMNPQGEIDLYYRGYYNMLGWGKYSGIGGKVFDCEKGSPYSFTCFATMGWFTKKSQFKVFATDYKNYDIHY